MDNLKVFEKYQLVKQMSPQLLEEFMRLVNALEHLENKCKHLESEVARLERLSNG